MSRIAFIGKGTVAGAEVDLLSTIGMAIAINGDELVTTPVGGAAAAVAQGYRAAAGRAPTRREKPTTEVDDVIVYPDERIHAALLTREPSPLTDRWTLLTSLDQLHRFTEGALYVLTTEGKAIA